ncbi:MAG: S-adenosylmethionine:tRNA ribosyltransferase-isomerase, partial [Acidobacteria bacterium]|nr:S-adenosylmethionine:tRNA ribosyltransferase-isomerase [Acidobacteriota bacterium]
MLVSDFSYELPAELIAQQPAAERDQSRLLRLSRRSGHFEDRGFGQFPELLDERDLLVLNNTRVFPARLFARRSGQKAVPLSARNPASRQFLRGQVEVLLTRELSREANEWQCLVHPGRKIDIGERLFFGERDELMATIVSRGDFGERRLRFEPTDDIFAVLERLGHVPLPPYICRPDQTADRERYQTVYARESGSVAAPTAGLHFTPGVLAGIRERGIE